MYEFFTVIDENHDDPTIYPVLSAPHESRPFEWEAADGSSPLEFSTKKVSVTRHTGNGWTEVKGFKDLTFTVSITDARVVVYCQKFTKGGGWWGFGIGGLAVAVVANAVSHARAMSRRKGKLLVAQVRYPWVCAVTAPTDRRGRKRTIRLVVNTGTDADPSYLALEIGMPERSGPADYAAHVAQLAAHERLSTAHLGADQRATCTALVAGPDRTEDHWPIPAPVVVGAPGSLPGGVARPAAPAPVEPVAVTPEPVTPAPVEPASAPPEAAMADRPPHGLADVDATVARSSLASAAATVEPLVPTTVARPGTCSACGAALSAAAKACGRCGKPVTTVTPEPVPDTSPRETFAGSLPEETMTVADLPAQVVAAADLPAQTMTVAELAALAGSADTTAEIAYSDVPPPPPVPPQPFSGSAGQPSVPRGVLPVEVVLIAVAMLALGGLLLYPFCRYGFPAIGELGSSNDFVRAFDALITYVLVLLGAAGVGLILLAIGLVRGSRVTQLVTCLVCGVLALAELINTDNQLTLQRTDSTIRVWVIVVCLVVIGLLSLPRARAFFAGDDQRPIGVESAAAVTMYFGVCAVVNGLLLTIVGTLGQKYVWFGLGLGFAGVVMMLTVRPLRAGRPPARVLASAAFVAYVTLGFVVLSDDPHSSSSPTVLIPLFVAIGALGALWLAPSSQEHFRTPRPLPAPHSGTVAAVIVAAVVLALLSGVGFHAASKNRTDYASSYEPVSTEPDPVYSTTDDPVTTTFTSDDARTVADTMFNDMESQSEVSTCNGSTSALDLNDYTIDQVTTQTTDEFLVSATVDLNDGSQETVTVLIGTDSAGDGCVEDDSLTVDQTSQATGSTDYTPVDVPSVPTSGDSVPTDAPLPDAPQDDALPYDSDQTPTDESQIVEYQPSDLDADQSAAVADVISFMAHVNQQDFDSAWQDSTDSLVGPSATATFRRGYNTTSFRQVAFGEPQALAPDLIVIPARFVSRQNPAAQGNPAGVTDCTLWPQYVFVVGYANGSWLTDVAGKYHARSELDDLKRTGDDGGSYLNPLEQRVSCS